MKAVRDEDTHVRLHVSDDNLPDRCAHGTYRRHVDNIVKCGLLVGGGWCHSRNHIHMIPHEPNDKRVISGMRKDCEIAIWIDLKKALEDGIPFYRSQNQVILTPGKEGRLSPKYFLKAKDLFTNEGLGW